MKKIFLLGIVAFISCAAFAQTKKIAHRSHSGKNSTLVMTTGDNFGIPVPSRKDTVVIKKDTTIKTPAKKYSRKKKKHTAAKAS